MKLTFPEINDYLNTITLIYFPGGGSNGGGGGGGTVPSPGPSA